MDNQPDVNTGSAPAAAESSPAESKTEFKIPTDPKGYQEWRYGKEAESPKPKQREASASSSEPSAEGEESPEGQKDAPDSEPGDKKQEQQPQLQRKNAADRLNELLGDLKRAGLTPHELKTFKREVQQQQQAQTPQAAPEKTAQPSTPAAAAIEAPKLEDFKTWEEYRAAERAYYKAELREEVRREFQETEVRKQAESRLAEAKQRYGDEAETYIRSTAAVVFNDQQIPSALKAVLNESAVCADVLYALGSDAKELDAFMELARTNPGQALRKVVLIEQLVQNELTKTPNGNGTAPAPERDESGKFVSSSKPPAPKKGAPPPASEVSGRASAPPDASEAAFARGDFRAFRDEENRRDLAARRLK